MLDRPIGRAYRNCSLRNCPSKSSQNRGKRELKYHNSTTHCTAPCSAAAASSPSSERENRSAASSTTVLLRLEKMIIIVDTLTSWYAVATVSAMDENTVRDRTSPIAGAYRSSSG